MTTTTIKHVIPTEKQEAFKFVNWVKYQPTIRDDIIHIPNEGRRGIVEGYNLVRAGLRVGAADYFITVPINSYHGMFLELKRKSGYHLPHEQKVFLKAMIEKGYAATFSFGADMSIDFVKKYLDGKLLISDMIVE